MCSSKINETSDIWIIADKEALLVQIPSHFQMELAHNGGTRKSPSPTAFQSSVRMRDGSASVIFSCSAHREALAFGANVLNLFGWKESRFVRPWENHRKTVWKWWFHGILWDYPLVMTNIAEDGHENNGFYHFSNGDLNHSYVSHYWRVCWRFRSFQIYLTQVTIVTSGRQPIQLGHLAHPEPRTASRPWNAHCAVTWAPCHCPESSVQHPSQCPRDSPPGSRTSWWWQSCWFFLEKHVNVGLNPSPQSP